MIRKILLWPDEGRVLHQKSMEVPPWMIGTPALDEMVRDLFETMYDAGGIGLSAIQVGIPYRVFVMDTEARAKVKQYAFINPEITTIGSKILTNEGCLSLPGILEMVNRHPTVKIRAQDTRGVAVEHTFTGLSAQCVQHEYDHLNGIVMPDLLTPVERTRLAAKLSKKGTE